MTASPLCAGCTRRAWSVSLRWICRGRWTPCASCVAVSKISACGRCASCLGCGACRPMIGATIRSTPRASISAFRFVYKYVDCQNGIFAVDERAQIQDLAMHFAPGNQEASGRQQRLEFGPVVAMVGKGRAQKRPDRLGGDRAGLANAPAQHGGVERQPSAHAVRHGCASPQHCNNHPRLSGGFWPPRNALTSGPPSCTCGRGGVAVSCDRGDDHICRHGCRRP